MNKKAYMQPAMQVNKIQQSNIICGSPGTNDDVSDKPSYSRQDDSWGDDEWDEE